VVFIPLAIVTGNIEPLYRVANFIAWAGCERREFASRLLAGKASPLVRPASSWPTTSQSRPSGAAARDSWPHFFLSQALADEDSRLGYAMNWRSSSRGPRRQCKERAAERIRGRASAEKGIHITTFVEARAPGTAACCPSKRPVYLAMETGAPCIPVSIWGTEAMMPKEACASGPAGRTSPSTAHESGRLRHARELSQAVRTAIASGLPEWMRG